jgi:hypothetical protein
MRAGLVARAGSGTTALVSGGLLCLAAIALVAASTPGLRGVTGARPVPDPDPAGPAQVEPPAEPMAEPARPLAVPPSREGAEPPSGTSPPPARPGPHTAATDAS